MTVHPTREQLAAFMASDLDAPLVMLNLIRYEETAKPGMGVDGLSGEQAYRRYMEAFAPMQQRYKSELLLIGPAGPRSSAPRTSAGTWCCWCGIRHGATSRRCLPTRNI